MTKKVTPDVAASLARIATSLASIVTSLQTLNTRLDRVTTYWTTQEWTPAPRHDRDYTLKRHYYLRTRNEDTSI